MVYDYGRANAKMLSLFEKEPLNWGLRGDPYLWQEMKGLLSETTTPTTKGGLEKVIATAFEALTLHRISESEPFYIERYSHGGMSSGMIAPDYWKDTVIPYLWRLIKGEDTGDLF